MSVFELEKCPFFQIGQNFRNPLVSLAGGKYGTLGHNPASKIKKDYCEVKYRVRAQCGGLGWDKIIH